MNENPSTVPSTPTETPEAAPQAVESTPAPTPAPAPAQAPLEHAPLTHEPYEPLAKKINRIMAYVLIISGISFVLIAILAIWNVFGDDAGTVVWRALGSLGAIALGALIVSVASKIITDHNK